MDQARTLAGTLRQTSWRYLWRAVDLARTLVGTLVRTLRRRSGTAAHEVLRGAQQQAQIGVRDQRHPAKKHE